MRTFYIFVCLANPSYVSIYLSILILRQFEIEKGKQLLARNTKDCIEGFKNVFQKLRENFNTQTGINIQILVSGVYDDLKDFSEYYQVMHHEAHLNDYS